MLKELAELINMGTFITGIIAGVFLAIILNVLFKFVMKNWKPILILSAVVGSVSLLIIAL